MQSILRLDVRGASHARKMTFTLENFPAGVRVDAEKVAEFMERRAPGRDKLSTARRETDEVVWRSGFAADGTTTGETIVGEIASRDMRPGDYGAERTIPRPGHADFGGEVERPPARCASNISHGAESSFRRRSWRLATQSAEKTRTTKRKF